MLVLIIHLPRATHRRANVDHLISTFERQDGLEVRVLEAVDGGGLSPDERAKWQQGKALHPPYPFGLNPGEIGCFLSHRLAWQTLLESDHDQALILEDDAQVDLTMLRQTLTQDAAYIQLPAEQPRNLQQVGPVPELLSLRPPALRTTAQWLSREAAQTLLSASLKFDRPIDVFLQMTWHHSVPIKTAYPNGISAVSGAAAKSTIQRKKQRGLMAEIRRSVQRIKFRRQIKSLSQKSF